LLGVCPRAELLCPAKSVALGFLLGPLSAELLGAAKFVMLGSFFGSPRAELLGPPKFVVLGFLFGVAGLVGCVFWSSLEALTFCWGIMAGTC